MRPVIFPLVGPSGTDATPSATSGERGAAECIGIEGTGTLRAS